MEPIKLDDQTIEIQTDTTTLQLDLVDLKLMIDRLDEASNEDAEKYIESLRKELLNTHGIHLSSSSAWTLDHHVNRLWQEFLKKTQEPSTSEQDST